MTAASELDYHDFFLVVGLVVASTFCQSLGWVLQKKAQSEEKSRQLAKYGPLSD